MPAVTSVTPVDVVYIHDRSRVLSNLSLRLSLRHHAASTSHRLLSHVSLNLSLFYPAASSSCRLLSPLRQCLSLFHHTTSTLIDFYQPQLHHIISLLPIPSCSIEFSLSSIPSQPICPNPNLSLPPSAGTTVATGVPLPAVNSVTPVDVVYIHDRSRVLSHLSLCLSLFHRAASTSHRLLSNLSLRLSLCHHAASTSHEL